MSGRAVPLRAVGAEDLRGLSLVLARAFRDDPLHRWMLPAELDWALFSAGIFGAVLRESQRAGGAETTEALEGAALWFPPYAPPASPCHRLAMTARGVLAMRGRAGRVGRELGRLERERPLDPHWYLAVLGTDPRHQGRGVGAALLGRALARCDAEGLPAYLESSKRSNLPFYERFGFCVLGEIRLESGPILWRMLRAPQPAEAQGQGGLPAQT